MIYTFDHNSEAMLVVITCDIPNKREYFSLSFDISVSMVKFDLMYIKFRFDFYHFYFLNMDISFNM